MIELPAPYTPDWMGDLPGSGEFKRQLHELTDEEQKDAWLNGEIPSASDGGKDDK